MATRRHRLRERRKTVGFTQERLAEQLGIDPTTVRRWESGESSPQPWLRPKLARCMGVSTERLEELLSNEADCPEKQDSSSGWASRKPSEENSNAKLSLTALAEVCFPVIIHGRPVLVVLGGNTEGPNWDIMSPSSRRLVLGFGAATAAASVFSIKDAAYPFHRPATPLTLPAPAQKSWATAIHDAVLNPMDAARRAATTLDNGTQDHHAPREVIDWVMRASLSSDYFALERSLPTLIGCVEAASIQAAGDEHAIGQALSDISDVYAVAGWTLIKADSVMGSWIAAQRAIQAAEQVGDVLRIAAATRCLGEVHMRAGNFEEATRTALLAAIQLENTPPDSRHTAVSLRGAALLSAAAASARRGDSREAHSALKAAEGCAAELGQDRADLATAFGPTNVAIHQVTIAIELGDARGALRHVPLVQLDRMPKPLTERRARFLIDVARSYAHVKDDTAAIDALIQAETIAPDELRHHRLTHELVLQLLAWESRTSELRALAGRCNLLA